MNDRKKDHINQAFNARVEKDAADKRFNYEPLLAAHPVGRPNSFSFAGGGLRSVPSAKKTNDRKFSKP